MGNENFLGNKHWFRRSGYDIIRSLDALVAIFYNTLTPDVQSINKYVMKHYWIYVV